MRIIWFGVDYFLKVLCLRFKNFKCSYVYMRLFRGIKFKVKEKKIEVELEYCILYEFICYVVLWFVSLI